MTISFASKHIHLDSYFVSLPKVKEGDGLKNSFECALHHFIGLKSKQNKYPDSKTQYTTFMKEHIAYISPTSLCACTR